MSSNKSAKEELIRRYGNKCFIERLHLRDTKGMTYTGCGQYKRMKMLTYHHIKMKKDGGKATVENGALLSNENHQWFHQQPMQEQNRMNNMFQELKREIDHNECRVEYADIECPFQVACVEMHIENNQIIVKKLSRKQKKQEMRKQKKKQKKEMQKLRKEYEDR